MIYFISGFVSFPIIACLWCWLARMWDNWYFKNKYYEKCETCGGYHYATRKDEP